MLDWKSEQFAIYNDLNFRNLGVRRPLNEWYTEHCGQFGIKSVSGTVEGYRQPRVENYNTLANYHKVNRNAGQPYFYGKDFSREVEWRNTTNNDISISSNGTILTKTSATGLWDAQVISSQKLCGDGFISFKVVSGLGIENYAVGLSRNPLEGPSYADIDYAIHVSLSGPNVKVWEKGVQKNNEPGMGAQGDYYRLLRKNGIIYYQRSQDGGKNYTTFYDSSANPSPTVGDLYPVISMETQNAQVGLVRVSNPQYDNWHVQHAIPQNELQYAWINSSYDNSQNQTFGYVSNFSIPSSSTSTTQSALPFVEEGHVSAGGINADFAGLNTLINDPVLPASNTLSSSDGDYRNTSIATINTTEQLNALNLHRNGPYQYPSWKQTRTGETPVARYHKNNNILSIGNEPTYVNLSGTTYLPNRPGTFNNFVEPPVTFKNKPLLTSFGQGPQIRSTYGNNKGHFSLGIALTQSIDDFIKITDREDPQAWDMFNAVTELRTAITANRYSEVIYPREMMTGLAETRGRTNYSEVATVDSNNSASLSNGTNGIDRGPLLRRTFWRDSETLRNRRSGFNILTSSAGRGGYTVTSSLPNSQGIYDGQATSVYGIGRTPFVYDTNTSCPDNLIAPNSFDYELDGVGCILPSEYPDTGELNSFNVHKYYGYAGTFSYSDYSYLTSSLGSQMTWYPTASSYYCHFPALGVGSFSPSGLQQYNDQHAWKVSEISGKYPWFDSYDDYSSDIRRMAKNYTIIPEFRMSQHMEYYISQSSGEFSAHNDKFLTLDGANITASANTEKSKPRSFNESFFNEYSNTDFQKYFGEFSENADLQKVSLKCNAVKKLLPYHGFYPINRTLQLSSMFSQSICPYISGISWSAGSTTDATKPPSGSLAIQSLLQPFFAPGILYNTIKSGVAVSWGTYTGSIPVVGTADPSYGVGFLSQSQNWNISFESILDPLGNEGVPNTDTSATSTDKKMYLLNPSYQKSSTVSVPQTNAAFSYANARAPYVELIGDDRLKAQNDAKYSMYQLAMNNFLAEIPNFFLNGPGGNFKRIVSTKKQSQISLTPGQEYYMDIFIDKDPELLLWRDYQSAKFTQASPYNIYTDGKSFGPPVKAGEDAAWLGDPRPIQRAPAYAPYTPPYYYGKSKVTLKYVATQADASGGFSFSNFFNSLTATFGNVELDQLFSLITGSSSPASQGRMTISSSIDYTGIFQQPNPTSDGTTGQLISAESTGDNSSDTWVISPRMETPVLDFSDQALVNYQPRGMWSGYGQINSGKNVRFGIEETYSPERPGTGSLVQEFFDTLSPEQRTQNIGQLAEEKEISEAIVAIPYVQDPIDSGTPFATTIPGLGNRQFFKINPSVYQVYSGWAEDNKFLLDQGQEPPPPELKAGSPFGQSQSILNLVKIARKYILPPELDFIYRNSGANKVNPFVMYMFEFKHKLTKQDLADIWQGVMPEISRTAEMSNEDVDENTFEHPVGTGEFFHGKAIPPEVRWMVFKVKRRANFDYYKVTADTKDDVRFRNDLKFNVNNEEIVYSYNWPYDYFSLVELAQIETNNDFDRGQRRQQVQVEQALQLGNLPGAAGSS
jgi:hypothetical protein